MEQFSETAPLVNVGFEGIGCLVFREVAQESGIELLPESARFCNRNFESLTLAAELMQKVGYLAQSDVMRDWDKTVFSIVRRHGLHALEFAAVFLAFKGCKHFRDKVINVDKIQFCFWVVDLYRKAVCDVVAECGHDAVVVRPAPLPEKIRKTIDQNFRSGLRSVGKHELFTSFLALAILAAFEPALKRRLDG